MLYKILNTTTNERQLSIGLLVLRLAVGVLMAQHGYQKLINFSAIEPKFMEFLGFSQSISLGLVVFAEFFCSLLLIAGLFTRMAALPLIVAMSVAAFHAHHGEIFGDGEKAFLFLAVYITLLLTGAGQYSADSALFGRKLIK